MAALVFEFFQPELPVDLIWVGPNAVTLFQATKLGEAAVAALPGLQGARGPDGLPGEKGAKGDRGDNGAPGPRGQSAVQPEVTLTANAILQSGIFYRLNSKAGSFDVTLPADPVDGARVTLAGKGWEINPVRVLPNGRLIDGSPYPLRLTDPSRDITMEFDSDLNSWSY